MDRNNTIIKLQLWQSFKVTALLTPVQIDWFLICLPLLFFALYGLHME